MDLVYSLLSGVLAGQPAWLVATIAMIVCGTLTITFMAAGPIVYVYVETKLAGFFQDGIGPKRVGPHGMLQTVADAVKLLSKEDIIPAWRTSGLSWQPRSSSSCPRTWRAIIPVWECGSTIKVSELFEKGISHDQKCT